MVKAITRNGWEYRHMFTKEFMCTVCLDRGKDSVFFPRGVTLAKSTGEWCVSCGAVFEEVGD